MVGTELEYDDLICPRRDASNKFSYCISKGEFSQSRPINSAADQYSFSELVSKNEDIKKSLAKQPSIKLKDFL